MRRRKQILRRNRRQSETKRRKDRPNSGRRGTPEAGSVLSRLRKEVSRECVRVNCDRKSQRMESVIAADDRGSFGIVFVIRQNLLIDAEGFDVARCGWHSRLPVRI
jgi:hypothetical protein